MKTIPHPSKKSLPTRTEILEEGDYSPDKPALFEYTIQSGDTRNALVWRFSVSPDRIISTYPLSSKGFLPDRK